ncbi:MAG: thioether cross-link-forming SCIFF peptide maturase [Bacillota bacterium]|nr:thioether cross-link-forming SCIFF peptide maturase [Bacillota bacterium]
MLHHFTLHGDTIVFDSESLVLLSVDDSARALLEAAPDGDWEGLSDSTLAEIAAQSGASPDDIAGCRAELIALRDSGYIHAPEQQAQYSDLYPDEPRIKSMCLHLCHDCNLRCRYCFAGTGDYGTGRRSFLTPETGRRAVDFLIAASGPRRHLDIDFFGGEPLLNWDTVVALTEYCETEGPRHGKDIRLTLTTNAVLLDEKKARFLDRHMKNVVLSLDGRPAVNDRMRPAANGRSSYAPVLSNILNFVRLRQDREHYVRGTYTCENCDFDRDVLHLADLGIEQLSMEPVVAPPEAPYAIKESDLSAIEKAYERLALAWLGRREEGRPFAFFHFNLDLEGGPCLYKRLKGCGAGSEYCAVAPDGTVYPCHQFVGDDSFRMGTVFDAPGELDRHVQEKFRTLLLTGRSDCRSCWARYLCAGGCAANNYHASGALDGRYELGCRLQLKRLECALWLEAKRREKIADAEVSE